MSAEERKAQWREKVNGGDYQQALTVVWGYLEAAEETKSEITPQELLDLIAKYSVRETKKGVA